MTTRTELLELIRNGENSGVEFKRDTLQNHDLAKELVAFSNFGGGRFFSALRMTDAYQASPEAISRSG